MPTRGDKSMCSVADYFERAAEFDELARSTSEPALKNRYANVAKSYRLLAIVRERLVATGDIELEEP